MASTGKIRTNVLRVYSGSDAITHATDGSLSFSVDEVDVTTKDSSGWKEILTGIRSGSISTSAMVALDATYGFEELYDAIAADTSLTIKYSTEVTGDMYHSVSAYCTSLEVNSSGPKGVATYSATFTITGTPTKGTVA